MATLRDGLSLLARRDFAKLFIAYLISYSGTAMAPIAMAFGVLDLTGSTRASSIVIAAPVAAQIAILLVGGALADRTSRKRMLVRADSLAMGAQLTIAWLFLTEALMICSLGGVLGMALGSAASWIIARLAGWQVLVTPEVVLAAVLSAGATGLVFGYFPARKAARLLPATALRSE